MSPRSVVVSLLLLGTVLAAPAAAERDNYNRRQLKPNGISTFDFFFNRKKKKRIDIVRDGRRLKRREVAIDDPQAAPSRRIAAPVPQAGNLVYRPEELKSLSALAFDEPTPAEPAALALYTALLDKTTPLRVTAEERKAALGLYGATGFRPLWTDRVGLTPRAKAMAVHFAAAAEDGLDPEEFILPQAAPGDLAALARLDLAMTAKALLYARQMSGGRLLPNRLTSYNDLASQRVDAAEAMRHLAWSPHPEAYLQSLAPRHPAYAAFKLELKAVRARLASDDPPIAEGRRVRPGTRDPRVPVVRARLERLGFTVKHTAQTYGADGLAGHTAQSGLAPEYLDPALATALSDFQKHNELRITGSIDNQTLRALNGRTAKRDEMRLIMNMERLRWLPDDLGNRHILVNQAAFELAVNDTGREVWRTKVIVGRPDMQTTAFHDEMETVVFNPAWGVPASIISNEMLPILRRDSSYLDRLGFTVLNKRGRRVKSTSVRWASYGDKVPYSVMQPPGADNALGEIKFLFPNSHDIYMHDTPSRKLFSRPVRAFSHGCVRVENPHRLAEIVLSWSAAEVDKAIASRRSQAIRLKQKLPVHLAYFTAWPDAAGKIVYYSDIYGRDRVMEQALSTPRVASR
jgi:murein L,D-transpeptidase YcbB/YkuD